MKKIVIIEDDTDVQQVYQEILAPHKYHVFPATTGQLGLQLISSEHPDLVILDIIMSESMNGLEILKEIRRTETMKHTPVLIVTNLHSERAAAIKSGATDFLAKADTSLDVFIGKVKKLLNG